MWLSSTSAASSTITANRITEHTNKDQMFAVASQRHDNVAMQGHSYQLNCHCKHTHMVLLLIPAISRCNISDLQEIYLTKLKQQTNYAQCGHNST